MATNKTYNIDSFEKLMNVLNDENFQRLSIDFVSWMATYLGHVNHIKKEYPKQTEGKDNWEITSSQFVWIDDGKNDLKSIELKDKSTGEIINSIKFDENQG